MFRYSAFRYGSRRLTVRRGALILLAAFACALGAQTPKPPRCSITFSVVRRDLLGNVDRGLTKDQAKWFKKSLAKKYPDVCYEPDGSGTLTFTITQTPAVYHGTRTVSESTESSSNVSGAVRDESGNAAYVDGTVKSDGSVDVPVPYEVKYGVYTLVVSNSSGTLRTFQQGHLYEQVALGLLKFGKGVHPTRTVVEQAIKWSEGNQPQ